jgi:hypothetical protein
LSCINPSNGRPIDLPRTKCGLGNNFVVEWVTAARLPARCRLYGLKKGGMRRIAEAGGTTHELMAYLELKKLAHKCGAP